MIAPYASITASVVASSMYLNVTLLKSEPICTVARSVDGPHRSTTVAGSVLTTVAPGTCLMRRSVAGPDACAHWPR